VALQGLRYTVAFMLSFRGSPLGVIAYVDPSGAPVLLCIIANHAPNAPIRSEGGATVFAIVRLSKRVRRAGEKMTPAASKWLPWRNSALALMRPVRGKAWTTRVVFDSLARALESGRAWRGVGSVKKLLHLEVLTLVVAAHWMICTT
jgi:hypothetical protein